MPGRKPAFRRMERLRVRDIDPLRAVMDPVEPAPDEVDVVHRTTPRVDEPFEHEIAGERRSAIRNRK